MTRRSRRGGSRRRSGLRAALSRTVLALLGAVALVLAPTGWTVATWARHHADVGSVDDAPVAMVLGAAVWDGEPSPFLAARLDVAVELWRAGTVRAVLVSGDNRAADYDEPGAMQRYLTAHGVPEDRIVKDPAGNNTYDSCRRARDVYGATEMVVVTQDYHLPRTVTACRALGIDAVGVGDTTVRQFGSTWWWGVAREVPANWKLVLDLVTDRSPTSSPYDPSLADAVARGR